MSSRKCAPTCSTQCALRCPSLPSTRFLRCVPDCSGHLRFFQAECRAGPKIGCSNQDDPNWR
eukprot:6309110-Pyramimonas_sp.AAC.1